MAVSICSCSIDDLVKHNIDHPEFQSLWHDVDIYHGHKLEPSLHAKLQVDEFKLLKELKAQWDTLKKSGPSLEEWPEILKRFESVAVLKDYPLKVVDDKMKEYVKNADIARRMVHIIEQVCPESGNLYPNVLATSGFLIGYMLACKGQFSAAAYFMGFAENVAGHKKVMGEEDDEKAFFDGLWLPARGKIQTVYHNVVAVAKEKPGDIDMNFVGLPGSFNVLYNVLLAFEAYEDLCKLRDKIRGEIEDPLMDAATDMQVYTAGRQLAMHFAEPNAESRVRITKSEGGVVVDTTNGRFSVKSNNRQLNLIILGGGGAKGKVESVLNSDRYILPVISRDYNCWVR